MRECFSELLVKAIAGDHDAIEEILKIYAPLIDHHSKILGYIDEDCRQYILMRIAISISKFII